MIIQSIALLLAAGSVAVDCQPWIHNSHRDFLAYVPGQPRVYTTNHKTRVFATTPDNNDFKPNHQTRKFYAVNSSDRKFETVVEPRAYPTAAETTPVYQPLTSAPPKGFPVRPAPEPFPTRQIDRVFPRLGKLKLVGQTATGGTTTPEINSNAANILGEPPAAGTSSVPGLIDSSPSTAGAGTNGFMPIDSGA